MTFYREWEPLLSAASQVQGRALVVAPHPDDEVIGCGGLISAHRVAGEMVKVVVFTDGAQGDPNAEGAREYIALRQSEAKAAGEALGGVSHEFLGHPDGRLRETEAPISELRQLIDEWRPATLLVPSPFEMHPDHRAASLLSLEAVKGAAHRPRLLLFEVGAMMPSNFLIDVTPWFEKKVAALRCYASQLEHMDLVPKMRALNRTRTVNVADTAVEAAEALIHLEIPRIDEFLQAVDTLLRIEGEMTPEIPGHS